MQGDPPAGTTDQCADPRLRNTFLGLILPTGPLQPTVVQDKINVLMI